MRAHDDHELTYPRSTNLRCKGPSKIARMRHKFAILSSLAQKIHVTDAIVPLGVLAALEKSGQSALANATAVISFLYQLTA